MPGMKPCPPNNLCKSCAKRRAAVLFARAKANPGLTETLRSHIELQKLQASIRDWMIQMLSENDMESGEDPAEYKKMHYQELIGECGERGWSINAIIEHTFNPKVPRAFIHEDRIDDHRTPFEYLGPDKVGFDYY